jgi:hypothetical protein
MSGGEMPKSAVARSHAVGVFQTTAMRRSALTSESWACCSSGSQKKIGNQFRWHDLGADLLVAAERTAQQLDDREAEFALELPAGGAGGKDLVACQQVTVETGLFDEIALPVVVCDQGDFLERIQGDILAGMKCVISVRRKRPSV